MLIRARRAGDRGAVKAPRNLTEDEPIDSALVSCVTSNPAGCGGCSARSSPVFCSLVIMHPGLSLRSTIPQHAQGRNGREARDASHDGAALAAFLDPNIGYWAEREDPAGALPPLYYTYQVGENWIGVIDSADCIIPLYRIGEVAAIPCLTMLEQCSARIRGSRVGASARRRYWLDCFGRCSPWLDLHLPSTSGSIRSELHSCCGASSSCSTWSNDARVGAVPSCLGIARQLPPFHAARPLVYLAVAGLVLAIHPRRASTRVRSRVRSWRRNARGRGGSSPGRRPPLGASLGRHWREPGPLVRSLGRESPQNSRFAEAFASDQALNHLPIGTLARR